MDLDLNVTVDGVENIHNVLSIFDGEMCAIKNFESILVSVNTNLVLLDSNSSVVVDDLEGYEALKERVDNEGLILQKGDSIVFNVKKESDMFKRGIVYVIGIITPEWENGLNRVEIVEQLDKGLNEAFMLCSHYDIESMAISNIYPFVPVPLVMELLSYYLIREKGNFLELCATRGTDVEGVYRINMLVHKLLKDNPRGIYIRSGGDIENDLITLMSFDNE